MDTRTPINSPEPLRRSGNYSPSVWGDYFLRYASISEEDYPEERQEHERLKDEVKKLLSSEDPDKFELIDNVQRLGISYHFENEIEALVQSLLQKFEQDDSDDLYTVALRFRLLRQLGHHVSPDVLKKFVGSEVTFKESSVSNVDGLLSLYEAANFMVHEEHILEEALIFTTSKLQSILPNLDDLLLVSRIKQALEFPIQKTINRIGARQFISAYEEDGSHDQVLLHFAKLDFNIIQRVHQKELSILTKWWKKLDVTKNTHFARDRLVECYLWKMSMYFEPKYSHSRLMMTKLISLTSLMDDMYDTYGTLDELNVFTNAIERWDISASDELPSYMRLCYESLLELFSEMEKGWSNSNDTIPMTYGISSMKTLARAYFKDATWIHSGHLPTFEEFMEVALVTASYEMLSINSFICDGNQNVHEDDLAWVAQNPPILNAASTINRLMDDIVGHEEEKEKGQIANAGECYMAQYGTSKEETFHEFEKRITNAWKDINKGWLDGCAYGIPKFVLHRIINLSKFMYYFYREVDGYTHSYTLAKHVIKSVLVDPIKI